MDSLAFSEKELELLLTFSKWHVVSSRVSECTPMSAPEDYHSWIKGHIHKHSYREMFFVVAGETFFSLNGISYPCVPGTLFLIDAGVEHDSYYPPSGADFRHIWFKLARKLVIVNSYTGKNNVRKRSNYSIICPEHSAMAFLEKWDYLLEAPEHKKEASLLGVKYAWGSLISELYKNDFHSKAEVPTRESAVKKVIEAVTEHIRETAGKGLDWNELSHFAGYSKYHFGRLFKKHTGQTVHGFINTCRVDRYHQLLKESYNHKEISDELGFSCPSAFSHWVRNNIKK